MKKLLTTFIFFLIFSISIISVAKAQGSSTLNDRTPATAAEAQAIATQIANSNCPDPIKNLLIEPTSPGKPKPGVTFYLEGSFIVAQSGTGASQKPIALTCASASSLQKIVIRLVMIIFALVGLVLAFSLAKSAIGMMTAFEDTDKFKENMQGLVKAGIYTVVTLFFYPLLVFLAVGVLGVGTQVTGKPEYNLFCQNQIIFNLAFDQSQPC